MRKELCMDDGWRFHREDVQDSVAHGYMYSYMHTKAERGRGPAAMDYDDRKWEKVNLPHDYVVEGVPDPSENPVHGSLARPNAWYRRFFRLNKEDQDKTVHLHFEGVGTECRIWVNGCFLGTNDSAYTEIDLDITDIARYGDDLNLVSVYIDNTEYEGWWYEGAGIYRHVWLIITEKTAIDNDGVYVHPVLRKEGLWDVPVELTIRNDSDWEKQTCITNIIVPAEAEESAAAVQSDPETNQKCRIPARSRKTGSITLKYEDPACWSPDSPNLYRLVTRIWTDGEVIDEVETIFGFRTIRFDPDRGFFLNGSSVKIKGMCMHEDFGGFGTGVPGEMKAYKVQRLKDMGCNGYRFSHNPHSRETLEACDRLGMLVMDENRWFDSSRNGLRRIRAMVKRDRNHPSVIMWSAGNEEFLQSGARGRKIMDSIRQEIHKLDAERPVMMAMHTGLLTDGAGTAADMIGMNYHIALHSAVHAKYPEKPVVFSEVNIAQDEDPMGNREEGIRTWEYTDKTPYLSGMFGWTAMDYRGEHDYPDLYANCGCMDPYGIEKDCFHLYQTYWLQHIPTYIQADWSGEHRVGEEIPVRVFSKGTEIELSVGDKKIGKKRNDPYFQTERRVPWQEGTLKATAFTNGERYDEAVVERTGAADHLKLSVIDFTAFSGLHRILMFRLDAVDAEDRPVRDAETAYQVTENRGMRVLFAGNGSIREQVNRRKSEYRTWRGHAVLFAEALEPEMYLKVRLAGGKESDCHHTLKAGNEKGFRAVAEYDSRYITDWEVSDRIPEETFICFPDLPAIKKLHFHREEVGHGTSLHTMEADNGLYVFHAAADIPDESCEREGKLHVVFELIEGRAEIRILRKRQENTSEYDIYTAEKTDEEPGECIVPIGKADPKDGETVEIYVCLHLTNPVHGITKPVRFA